MQNQSQLFEAIFKRKTDATDNISFLEDIAAQHPYFATAHFFLLQKKGGADEQQAAKTALLFNNPHWLNYQLNFAKQKKNIAKETITEATSIPMLNDMEDRIDEERSNIGPVIVATADATTVEADQPQTVVHIAEEQTDDGRPYIEATALKKNSMNEAIDRSKITGTVQETMINEDPTPNEPMLFEPMYMVDYFASQGIKLSEEEILAGDKLGKQLKSFTEWLKTMKRIHAEKLPETSQQADITVQTLAEKSNAEDEVVTGSMAEVFAMQGKLSKAKAVYQKLSLLDPSKSAFFAAKIEQLKG